MQAFGRCTARIALRGSQVRPGCTAPFSSTHPREAAKASIEDIRRLRQASGAPVADCKAALIADGVGGDVSRAFDWLRKRGVLKASAMASRAANEGLVGLTMSESGDVAALVEVNSETDFVARNKLFQNFVKDVGAVAVASARVDGGSGSEGGVAALDVAVLMSSEVPGRSAAMSDALADLVGSIRENITLRRAVAVTAAGSGGGSSGAASRSGGSILCGYVHAPVASGMGKMAAVVALGVAPAAPVGGSGSGGGAEAMAAVTAAATAVGRRLAMHVVAAHPRFLSPAAAPAAALERERAVIAAKAAKSGKPPAMVARMSEGMERKFLEENSLLRQGHLLEEGAPRVEDHLRAVGAVAGAELTVLGFARFAVGEAEG